MQRRADEGWPFSSIITMKARIITCLLCLACLPLWGQSLSTDSASSSIILTYQESFENDQALVDAHDHSPCWPLTAESAVEAHLRYRQQEGNRVLDLIGSNRQAAYVLYRFPQDANAILTRPLNGTVSVQVGCRRSLSEAAETSKVVYYATSDDDRQWSPTQALTPGEHTLTVSAATGQLYLLLWSRRGWIDNLDVTLSYAPATLHVPSDYATIQAALDAAQDGDIIEVAAGVYQDNGNTDLDCQGKAITLRGPDGPDKTIIRCGNQRQQRGFYFHRGESADCVIEGFTIEQGSALTGSLPQNVAQWASTKSMPLGGGIYCLNSSPTLINCVIRECRAVVGGGVACVGGQPRLIDCRIEDCQARITASQSSQHAGAGVALLHCRRAQLLGCTLQGNDITGAGCGAGLYLQSGSQTLSHCVLHDNQNNGNGGGLYARGSNLQISLDHCRITQNTAASGAGLMFEADNNDTTDYLSPVTISNCTIADNVLANEVASVTSGNGLWVNGRPLILSNSILWNSLPSLVLNDPTGTSDIRYCLIEGGYPGVEILDQDPCFNCDDANDYHLQSDVGRYDELLDQWVIDSVHSPAIDAGDPNSGTGLESKNHGNRINLGAYGGYRQASRSHRNNVYHVDASNGNDNNTGLSQDQAFATIQHAIDQSDDGDRILVWPEMYQEELSLHGKAITLEGVDGSPILTAPGGIALTFSSAEGADTIVRHLIIADCDMAAYCYLSRPTLEHLTIVNNSYGIYGEYGANPTIRNCILWNNAYSDLYPCQASYSCIERKTEATGLGNLTDDPLFVDPDTDDYHLMSNQGHFDLLTETWISDTVSSPCIDAGDPDDDIAAESSPHGRRVNMGAYGRTAQASLSPTSTDSSTEIESSANPVAVTPTLNTAPSTDDDPNESTTTALQGGSDLIYP